MSGSSTRAGSALPDRDGAGDCKTPHKSPRPLPLWPCSGQCGAPTALRNGSISCGPGTSDGIGTKPREGSVIRPHDDFTKRFAITVGLIIGLLGLNLAPALM